MLVSILVCNHNYARFLGPCLDSVLAQDHADIEVVVVDDASTDESAEVLSEYSADSRVTVLRNEWNVGQAACMNQAFASCSGEYVAFLDSDDRWCPSKVASCVQALANDRELVAVQHNMMVLDESGRLVGNRVHPGLVPGRRDVLATLREGSRVYPFCPTSGLFVRKSVLDRVFPLPQSFRICADIPLVYGLCMHGPVRTLPDLLGYYRVHGRNNWMGTVGQRQSMSRALREARCVNALLARHGYPERVPEPEFPWRPGLFQLLCDLFHPADGSDEPIRVTVVGMDLDWLKPPEFRAVLVRRSADGGSVGATGAEHACLTILGSGMHCEGLAVPFGLRNVALLRETQTAEGDWIRLVTRMAKELSWETGLSMGACGRQPDLQVLSPDTLAGLDLRSVQVVCFTDLSRESLAGRLASLVGSVASEMWGNRGDLNDALDGLRQVRARLSYMQGSLSWRITSPLRFALALAKRTVRGLSGRGM